MGQGQSSRRDLILFEELSAWGTMGTAGYQMRITGCTPQSTQALEPNPVYTGNRLEGPPFFGNVDCGVSVDTGIYPDDEAGWWLKHGIGRPKTTTGHTSAAAYYLHEYRAGYDGSSGSFVESSLPDYGVSAEVGYPDLATAQYQQFVGGKIAQITIPFGASGRSAMQVNMTFKEDTYATSRKDGSFTTYTSLPASHTNIAAANIKEAGVASAIILGGDIVLTNNLDTSDDVRVVGGGGKLGQLPEGNAVCTGRLRWQFDSAAGLTLLNKAIGNTETALSVRWTVGTSYLEIECPEIQLARATPVPGAGTGLVVDTTFRAFNGNDADATVLKAILYNQVSSY